MRCFPSNSKLNDHITDSDYEENQNKKICFAVVLTHFETDGDWELKYSLRYNYTDTNPDNQSLLGSQ